MTRILVGLVVLGTLGWLGWLVGAHLLGQSGWWLTDTLVGVAILIAGVAASVAAVAIILGMAWAIGDAIINGSR